MIRKMLLATVMVLCSIHVGWSAPSAVWETGQTSVYAAGDDGDLGPGVAWPDPRFSDNGDGTVTDNLTGLVWLRDANCFGGQTWTDALSSANSLASGSCGLTDGSATGQWRLPNREELYSLVDFAFYSPSLPNAAGTGQWVEGDPFTDVQSDRYWSSTTYAPITSYAWVVFMGSGSVIPGVKTFVYYVWPVRIGLSGNPVISLSSPSLSFGTVDPGSSSPAQTLTVGNTGTNTLYISAITLTGTDPSEFETQNDNCSGAMVAPSGTCTINVIFSPTTGGAKSAILSIPSNAPTGTASVSLTGTGAENVPPTASASYTYDAGSWTITLTDTSTPGSSPLQSVSMSWGDGTLTAQGPGTTFTHTYMTAGAYTITQTATDTDGLTASAQYPVTVANPVIKGHVFRSDGTTPVGGALVFVTRTSNGKTNTYITATKTDGSFSYSNIGPGTYNQLRATRPGYTFPAPTNMIDTNGGDNVIRAISP